MAAELPLVFVEPYNCFKNCVLFGRTCHRPVIVKRALIGSKGGWGGWTRSTIFMLKSVSWLVNNKITGNYSYLLDGYIFAACFERAYHYFFLLSSLVWLRKKGPCILLFLYNEIFLSCRVPTFRGKKVVKHGGHRGISYLSIGWTMSDL